MQFSVQLCPVSVGLWGQSAPSLSHAGGVVQRENPPCSPGGTLPDVQALGCRITVTITTIYTLESRLPRQGDKYLKILYIIGPILFLIYKVNCLY